MSFPAARVKELRERTGAGFARCKEALEQSGGDLDAAAEWLQARGAQLAERKSGRETNEGRVSFAAAGNRGALVEVLTETDFVANNDSLREFADFAARAAAGMEDGGAPLSEASADGRTVEEARLDVLSKTGENIRLGRHETLTASGALHHYIHHNGKIGVMADVTGSDDPQLGKDICMQIASMRPEVVAPEDYDAGRLDSVKESFEREVAEGGKDPAVRERIVAGKLGKFVAGKALLKQDFIKDDRTKVEKHLRDNGAEVGGFAAIYLD